MSKVRFSFPTFRQPKTVTYGVGSRKMLARCDDLQRTVIFLSGRDEVRQAIETALGDRFAAMRICVKPAGEPTRDMVRAGADFLAGESFERIVGIGGGSVLDWCRLAWVEYAGLLPENPPSSVQINEPAQNGMGEKPQFWLAPTTCATGGEGAAVAVFSDHDGRKIPVVSDHFLADRVILDGYFLESMSPSAMADSLADAMSHAIESFLSLVPSSLAEDAAATALRRIFDVYGPDPLWASSRCRNQALMEAGYQAGLAASNKSVGIVHAFAHSVSKHGIAHGHGNALGLLAGIKLNADTPAMEKLLRRCSLMNVRELCDQVGAILRPAFHQEDVQWAEQLRDEGFRRMITEDMMQDVCLRTNPKRVDDLGIATFLDGVVNAIEVAKAVEVR